MDFERQRRWLCLGRMDVERTLDLNNRLYSYQGADVWSGRQVVAGGGRLPEMVRDQQEVKNNTTFPNRLADRQIIIEIEPNCGPIASKYMGISVSCRRDREAGAAQLLQRSDLGRLKCYRPTAGQIPYAGNRPIQSPRWPHRAVKTGNIGARLWIGGQIFRFLIGDRGPTVKACLARHFGEIPECASVVGHKYPILG